MLNCFEFGPAVKKEINCFEFGPAVKKEMYNKDLYRKNLH